MWSSDSGELVKVVEKEVEEVRVEWEESRAVVSRLQTTVTEMTARLVSLVTPFRAHHRLPYLVHNITIK